MKLMFVVLPAGDADGVVQTLVDNQYRVTRVASTGGLMRHGNVTLMTGIEEDQVQAVIDLLHGTYRSPEDSEHRATLFVVDMPYFEQL